MKVETFLMKLFKGSNYEIFINKHFLDDQIIQTMSIALEDMPVKELANNLDLLAREMHMEVSKVARQTKLRRFDPIGKGITKTEDIDIMWSK